MVADDTLAERQSGPDRPRPVPAARVEPSLWWSPWSAVLLASSVFGRRVFDTPSTEDVANEHVPDPPPSARPRQRGPLLPQRSEDARPNSCRHSRGRATRALGARFRGRRLDAMTLRSIAESWSDRLPLRVVPQGRPGSPSDWRARGTWAAMRLDGEVLLFCDDDDVADEGWIAAMAAISRSCAAFGGPQRRAAPERSRRPRVALSTGPPDVCRSPLESPMRPWATTPVSARTAFRAVDGFDPEFSEFSCGEEVDFFWRVQRAGTTCDTCPMRSCTSGTGAASRHSCASRIATGSPTRCCSGASAPRAWAHLSRETLAVRSGSRAASPRRSRAGRSAARGSG